MTTIPTPCSEEGRKHLKKTYPDGTEVWCYICRGGYWELTDEKAPGEDVPWWCTESTEHYGNGLEVLRHYDVNNNNRIDTTELQQAIADIDAGKINSGEAMIVRRGWLLGDAGFDSVCGRAPPVTPPTSLTPDEALLRIRAGEKCYIKCTLPILNILPGILYTPGVWVPPFCAITTES